MTTLPGEAAFITGARLSADRLIRCYRALNIPVGLCGVALGLGVAGAQWA